MYSFSIHPFILCMCCSARLPFMQLLLEWVNGRGGKRRKLLHNKIPKKGSTIDVGKGRCPSEKDKGDGAGRKPRKARTKYPARARRDPRVKQTAPNK